MDAGFWHERWANDQIAFHERKPNRLLLAHVGALDLAPDARVFVPLCGKTIDIHWLLARGLRVIGIDLSAKAIAQLFADLGLTPKITTEGALERYSAERIDIFVGDIFALTETTLDAVDAVYDRAALVALPADMRERYAAHLAAITGTAPQLLLCFEYDPSLFDGPPFSVPPEEIARVHGARYAIEALARERVPGGLKRHEAVDDTAWLLTAKTG